MLEAGLSCRFSPNVATKLGVNTAPLNRVHINQHLENRKMFALLPFTEKKNHRNVFIQQNGTRYTWELGDVFFEHHSLELHIYSIRNRGGGASYSSLKFVWNPTTTYF